MPCCILESETKRSNEVKEMTSKERAIAEKHFENLFNSIGIRFGTVICNSMITLHGGLPENLGTWELESLQDDLITIENDR